MALAVLLLAGGALATVGHFVSRPADTPAKAELIVALGGDSGNRVRLAQQLYADGYASSILLTGIEFGEPLVRSAYQEWRAAFLVGRGVPARAILFDNRSSNSWEEATNTAVLMQRKGWRTVLVVSDPPHLRRLSWVWGKAFAGSGLEYRLIAAPMVGWEAGSWWRDEKSGQFVLMELIKLGYYLVKY
jgi:uncharacterized SAM-binding protein YcdF (DUF218 family)